MMDVPEFFFFFFFPRNLSDFTFSIEIVFCFPLFHNHPPIHETLFHHWYSLVFILFVSLSLSLFLSLFDREREREKRERRKIRTRLNDSIGERSGRQEATGLLLSLLTK